MYVTITVFSSDEFDILHCTVARKVPFDDPEVLNYVRIGYVASQALALAVYFYISYKVCSSIIWQRMTRY